MSYKNERDEAAKTFAKNIILMDAPNLDPINIAYDFKAGHDHCLQSEVVKRLAEEIKDLAIELAHLQVELAWEYSTNVGSETFEKYYEEPESLIIYEQAKKEAGIE